MVNQSLPARSGVAPSGLDKWRVAPPPETVSPKGAEGESASANHSPEFSGGDGGGSEGSVHQPGAAPAAVELAPWNPADYRDYMSLISGLGAGAASLRDRSAGLGGSAEAPAGTPSAAGDAVVSNPAAPGLPGLPTLPSSQSIAQAAIQVLWRNWEQFDSGDAVFRAGITAALEQNKIPVEDRAALLQLLDDPQAFDWLDRLDLNRNGSISREMLGAYVASDPAGGPQVATPNTTPSAADDPALAAVVDNFGAIDAAGSLDGSVSIADVAAAGKSAILEGQSRQLLEMLGNDAAVFGQYDALDGAADGYINASGLQSMLGGGAEGSASPLPASAVPSAAQGRYSDSFYALAQEILNNPASVGADAAGNFTAGSLASSLASNASPALGALASDALLFKLLDALDGSEDGQASVGGVERFLSPASGFAKMTVAGADGQQHNVISEALGALGEDYAKSVVLPQMPPEVNNTNQRAYRMAMAVLDNFALIKGPVPPGSEPLPPYSLDITRAQLAAAATNPQISADDQLLIAELARDREVYDWLAIDNVSGNFSSRLYLDHLKNLVGTWNKVHFNDLMAAHSAINTGISSLKAGENDRLGFDDGMSADYARTQVFDPGTIEKYFNRMMGDPSVLADLRAKIGSLVPDAKAQAQSIFDSLTGPAYAGYLNWIQKQPGAPDDAALSKLSGDLYYLNLLDGDLAAKADKVVRDRLLLAAVQDYGLKALEAGNTDVLQTLIEDVVKEFGRGARAFVRLVGNGIAALDDSARVAPEFKRVIDAFLPGGLPDYVPTTDHLLGSGTLDKGSLLQEANKSGIAGIFASGLGYFLGAYTLISHSQDGLAKDATQRMEEALAFIAPLSYSHQIVKGVQTAVMHEVDAVVKRGEAEAAEVVRKAVERNFITPMEAEELLPGLERQYVQRQIKMLGPSADVARWVDDFSTLSGRSLIDIVGADSRNLVDAYGAPLPKYDSSSLSKAQQYLHEDSLRKPYSVSVRTSATLWKAAIPMLDVAGGVISSVISAPLIKQGKEENDAAATVAGYMMTGSGLSWAAGGMISFMSSALAGPMFVLSGILAIGGLVAEAFRDPSKQFTHAFAENYGVLDEIGGFREDGKAALSQWYKDHYRDNTVTMSELSEL